MAKHVVVGIDGSQRGMAALAWACDAARRRKAELRVVHVAAPWAERETADPRVARIYQWARDSAREVVDHGVATAHDSDVQAMGVVRYGEPAQELLSEGAGASLLVMGSRGVGGFAGLLLGSVALHVTAHATSPVVVVRHDEPQGRDEGYGQIVTGVDGSPEAANAARFAIAEAAIRGARLRVLRAWSNPLASIPLSVLPGGGRGNDKDLREVEMALDTAVVELHRSQPDVEVTHEVVRGRAAGVLTAASETADMVVVGSRGRGALAGMVLGSVSHALLHHARCPVAVVRQTRAV